MSWPLQEFLHKGGLNEKNVVTVLSGLKEVRAYDVPNLIFLLCDALTVSHLPDVSGPAKSRQLYCVAT